MRERGALAEASGQSRGTNSYHPNQLNQEKREKRLACVDKVQNLACIYIMKRGK